MSIDALPDTTTPAGLAALQLQRLQQTVARCHAALPQFRQRCRALSVLPGDLHSLADLARLPLTSKQDLRADYPFAGLTVPRESLVRVHSSSALEGRPTLMGFNAHDVALWAQLMRRTLVAAGVRTGDLIHIAYPYGMNPSGLGVHAGAEALGCTVLPMSGGRTLMQAQMLVDLRPRVIVATPSYLQTIFDALRELGSDPRQVGLELALLGGEPWTPAQRDRIETEGGVRCHELYGISELIGPGIAVETADEPGAARIWEDQFLAEIIDPATGVPLPDHPVHGTAIGELVLTSLSLQAQPLVRFRTHDLTRLMPAGPSGFRRIARIVGRSDDQIVVRGLKFSPSDIEALLVKDAALSATFRLLLSRPKTMDEVRLEVELGDAREVWNTEPIASRTAQRIRNLMGLRCTVAVLNPGALKREADGHVQRVIDKRF
jgi:phenylacetate-CoA ligase